MPVALIPCMATSHDFDITRPGCVVVLDCRGEEQPAICFVLDLAGCHVRVVADEQEAFNLFSNAHQTGESLACLVVNNPQLDVDITRVLDQMPKLRIEVPILFVKQCEKLVPTVDAFARDRRLVRISACGPDQLVQQISRFAAEEQTTSESTLSSAGGRCDEKNSYGR